MTEKSLLRWPLRLAGLFGLSAIALAALGSHLLKADLSPADYERLQTGLGLHELHAVAMLALALAFLLGGRSRRKGLLTAFACFALGTLLFSGTLYLRALTGISLPLAPAGGALLMLGWLRLVF